MSIRLGHSQPALNVCLEHTPHWPAPGFTDKSPYLTTERLHQLVASNSNHWRKIFNVYAKLLFALQPTVASSWQQLRDHDLLQKGHLHALTLAAVTLPDTVQGLRLIAGKTYAGKLYGDKRLDQPLPGVWADQQNRVLVTPYFDYRALPNRKIEELAELIRSYWPAQAANCMAPAQATPVPN